MSNASQEVLIGREEAIQVYCFQEIDARKPFHNPRTASQAIERMEIRNKVFIILVLNWELVKREEVLVINPSWVIVPFDKRRQYN